MCGTGTIVRTSDLSGYDSDNEESEDELHQYTDCAGPHVSLLAKVTLAGPAMHVPMVSRSGRSSLRLLLMLRLQPRGSQTTATNSISGGATASNTS